MGTTGLEQLIAKGWRVRIATYYPITKQYISAGITKDITPIHYGVAGKTIFVSKELALFLDSPDSVVDPEKPLQAICKFKPKSNE